MTKRLMLIYPDERPTDAPEVVWMQDAADLELVVERFPGAVGYIDLDDGDLEVRPGAVDVDTIRSQLDRVIR
ncbi:hypothetical protein HC251_22505 [Iamia sp. SCSIO 61187]|uniref:hypothetical protein n=1 Tax=Iamia sp. SCSIO 61187 TaxID=2722752 RepID=UPI001C6273D4|nr:hypothetical protein [Iamia sp. SCSIO 61187]QYG94928.1 hypothetical protein HC251_22505 [Iamia sp. SCSIO 61187]